VNALYGIIVDVSISDELGRTLWKENFVDEGGEGLQVAVRWSDFWSALANYVRAADIADEFARTCIRILLINDEEGAREEMVNLRRFGWLLQWFPMSSGGLPTRFLLEIAKLCSFPYVGAHTFIYQSNYLVLCTFVLSVVCMLSTFREIYMHGICCVCRCICTNKMGFNILFCQCRGFHGDISREAAEAFLKVAERNNTYLVSPGHYSDLSYFVS
tara:strand:- start:71 stop:715 length:645 start_codon:yes stop_codon:yes gene_type:complete